MKEQHIDLLLCFLFGAVLTLGFFLLREVPISVRFFDLRAREVQSVTVQKSGWMTIQTDDPERIEALCNQLSAFRGARVRRNSSDTGREYFLSIEFQLKNGKTQMFRILSAWNWVSYREHTISRIYAPDVESVIELNEWLRVWNG